MEWFDANLPQLLSGFSLITFFLVFLAGVITSIGPCNAAMIPVIMAYIGGKEEVDRTSSFRLSLFFTLGTAVTFMLLGVVIAFIGGIFGFAQSALYYTAAIICILIGLSLLNILSIRMPGFTRMPSAVVEQKGNAGAFLLGMTMGLAGSQCGTPIMFAILSLVMLEGRMTYGAALLFCHALGRGTPLILAGTFTGLLKNNAALARFSGWMESTAGIVLLLVGFYFLWIA